MVPERKNLYLFAVLGLLLFVPLIFFATLAIRRNLNGPNGFNREFRVRRGAIDSHIAANGRVEGATSQEVKLASRVVGRLKEVSVADGDPVRKGQVVAVLENNDIRAKVEEARANLERAQAALEKLLNGARLEEREAARAEMLEAQATADNARQNYERAQKLFKDGGVVSQSALDQAERDQKVSWAKLESVRQRYELVIAPPRHEDAAAAQAEVALARAQLAEAQDNYDNTFVRSPVDGVVIKRFMNPGESISYESLYQPIVSVADTSRLTVRAEVDETDIGKIQLGQRAEIRCDAFPGQTFVGHVRRISGGLGKKKIQVDNPMEKIDTDVLETFVEVAPGSPLRVGLRVDVYVPLAHRENVLIVPRRAVEITSGAPSVRLRVGTGFEQRPVHLGAQDGLNVEIADGLKEGDAVAY